MANSKYDIIIIGGGPAGLTAGLYTTRAGLEAILIEMGLFGGQIVNAEQVENYPGFPEGIGGLQLGQLLHQQAAKFGLNTLLAEVTGVKFDGEQKNVTTTEGTLVTKAVIIAGGSERQKLGVPGEQEFIGKGLSYCATCDGPFFREQSVAVVGGGDAAITEALHLAKFASKVTIIHRRHQLRATAILQERAFNEPKIDFIWDSMVDEIEGEDFVKKLKLHNVVTEEKSTLEIAGVFISVGFKPRTDYLRGILPLDNIGQIITDENMSTQIPGVFAAGDIRHNSGRQAIIAAGDGATAAIYAERFISRLD